jgi:serine/threonine-protein kinase
MAGHMNANPKPIRKLRPEVPAGLEAVVMHAMRRYPEHRYPTAVAITEDLDRFETLDPSQFDVSAEKPMGGMAGADSAKRLWAWVALIGFGFIGIVAVVLALSFLLR